MRYDKDKNSQKIFLESERLYFKFWDQSKEDFKLANLVWGNQQVTRYIRKNGPYDDNEIEERLVKEIETQKKYGYQYFPMFLKDTKCFVGVCGLRGSPENAEFGIHLLPSYWKKGLASEAAKVIILNYTFKQLKIKKIRAGHHPLNESSKKLLVRLGFQFTMFEYYDQTQLEHPMYELKNIYF